MDLSDEMCRYLAPDEAPVVSGPVLRDAYHGNDAFEGKGKLLHEIQQYLRDAILKLNREENNG